MAEVLSDDHVDKAPQPNPVDVYESFEDHHWWYVCRNNWASVLFWISAETDCACGPSHVPEPTDGART